MESPTPFSFGKGSSPKDARGQKSPSRPLGVMNRVAGLFRHKQTDGKKSVGPPCLPMMMANLAAEAEDGGLEALAVRLTEWQLVENVEALEGKILRAKLGPATEEVVYTRKLAQAFLEMVKEAGARRPEQYKPPSQFLQGVGKIWRNKANGSKLKAYGTKKWERALAWACLYVQLSDESKRPDNFIIDWDAVAALEEEGVHEGEAAPDFEEEAPEDWKDCEGEGEDQLAAQEEGYGEMATWESHENVLLDHEGQLQQLTAYIEVLERRLATNESRMATMEKALERMAAMEKTLEKREKMAPLTIDRKSTRLNSSHSQQSRMPSSA